MRSNTQSDSILSNLLKPQFEQKDHLYQYHLQQVTVSELHTLVESFIQRNANASLAATIQQMQKLAKEISLTSSVTISQDVDGFTWQQNTDVDLRIKLNEIKQGQDEMLTKLDREPTLKEALAVLEASGLGAIPVTIKKAKLIKNTLTINDTHAINFAANSIQSRFISLFFNGAETLKKRAFEFGDIFDRLEPRTYSNLTKDKKTALKRRYYEARDNINTKIKSQTGLNIDFIIFENEHFSINHDLLK